MYSYFPGPQDALLYLAHSDPHTSDHCRNDSFDLWLRQLHDPYMSGCRHNDSHNRPLCQLQPRMDDMAWPHEQRDLTRSNEGHIAECPCMRHSTGRDFCARDFDPIDSPVRGCPSCWHNHGRDYVPSFYRLPAYEHLEIPALIRAARDVETTRRIVRS